MNGMWAAVILSVVLSVAFAPFIRDAWSRVAKNADTPKPCKHEWEPWSDKQEVEVKQADFGGAYSLLKISEKEYKGVFQDRVCSKCNIYERRWA